MSFVLHGVGVSEGIAIGHAHLASHAALEVAHHVVPEDQVTNEISRLDTAFTTVRKELQALHDTVVSGPAAAEYEAFLDLHRMILDDPTLSTAAKAYIAQNQCNAEWAITQQMGVLMAQFEEIEDPYLRERKTDVIQVVERVLKVLLGHPGYIPPSQKRDGDSVLVAHDLSPADVLQYKQYSFTAFLTDLGGLTSHTAIVARSLNIPSVVALHHARRLIRENDILIVDGNQGVVIVDPDEHVLAEYRLRQSELELEKQKLKRLRTTVAATLDGTVVELYANIELPQDVDQVKENGATGVGLFRSEFLFLNRDSLPDEEEQFEAYRTVARKMRGMPVTVRTFDLGADKNLDHAKRVAANPALGLRAIRLSLAEPQMFNIQLRAILRASRYGQIRILVPMLSNVAEITQTLHLIQSAKQSLRNEKIPFDEKVQVGGMIEIPAAALSLDIFMRKLDFLSIGTNDLIQYTLAIDRADDTVAHLYDSLHPAVLRLVAHVIRSANRASIPVSVCGEIAGDVVFTRLLLGFGLRVFSMHPVQLLTVKREVLRANLPDLIPITQKILKTADPEKIHALLAKLNA
ncbi:phosphoenolpyruvate--protein phosphotransferase [Nitrosospira multiformis ATCC 25196]|uniref:Phosphoenolpyruvate-protein phosphotransferase n=1 Tax=Nitrosospira multiformis (strain ATCC 25196 / NCIMB 11849 / C 71) TaxID=323848 RepID=Q2YCJ3_NITMU|nr:phosphoenolpyruvate--protein phosphotransferase [Nitrosospira multiformis]ABB73528.1 phosphoenolpyruvate--protein phosphotransferase [Nitrosospira multiformis ATCC 25196]SEF81907.1 phosphoenolpyruvate--protein phosphotransferase [Nitrosospira multiformis ATCC 25196]